MISAVPVFPSPECKLLHMPSFPVHCWLHENYENKNLGITGLLDFRSVRAEAPKNKPVMALGLLSLTLCVGYLGYLHAVRDNQQQLYEAVDSQGERHMRRKSSRWD
uniref:Small integral membrane protein 8 n=1 Tax=Cyprinus carpio TaxID=7962 RepID=A0A8C2HJL6_CYPCA